MRTRTGCVSPTEQIESADVIGSDKASRTRNGRVCDFASLVVMLIPFEWNAEKRFNLLNDQRPVPTNDEFKSDSQ